MTKDDGQKKDEQASVLNGSTVVDVMSPYYVAGSDSPNLVFTSDLLNDGNFADWADEMSNALYAKNKIGFVDGSIPIPEGNSLELALWKRCNALVRGWLHSSMEKEIRNSVKHAKTAHEIWEDLKERFGSESAPRAFELKRAISLTRQDRLSVSAYYTKLKGLWDEFQSISPIPRCKCNGCKCDVSKQITETREKERLYEFLMGLDETYGVVKTQILSTKPIVSLGAAFHLVSEDEFQRQIGAVGRSSIEGAAFQFQNYRQQDKTARTADKQREPTKCTYCGKLYHTIEECYKLNGYPKPKPEDQAESGVGKKDSWKKAKNSNKSAHMTAVPSPISSLSDEQFALAANWFEKGVAGSSQVAKGENTPTINMAGLTFEDPVWSG